MATTERLRGEFNSPCGLGSRKAHLLPGRTSLGRTSIVTNRLQPRCAVYWFCLGHDVNDFWNVGFKRGPFRDHPGRERQHRCIPLYLN